MVVQDLAMFEIIATIHSIDGIEMQGIYVSRQSTLELDVVATPAINYVMLYAAIRELGLMPIIRQHSKLNDTQHGLQLMIEVAPGWQPPRC